ncbi:MAG: hypothetical protein KDA28_03165, partial [Phycisphaerales bacterium]|nr:hypothetical protein [Phycisphaerales bacterium]
MLISPVLQVAMLLEPRLTDVWTPNVALDTIASRVASDPSWHRPQVVLDALKDPWTLDVVATRALETTSLDDTIRQAGAFMGIDARGSRLATFGDVRREVLASFEPLDEEAKRDTFEYATEYFRDFYPHHNGLPESSVARHERSRTCVRRWNEEVDRARLLHAASELVRLANEFEFPEGSFQKPRIMEVDGVRALIGTMGDDHHELTADIHIVCDPGGDDTYTGALGATSSPDQGLSIIIDRAGNDTYDGIECGLATGRLGIGMIFDRAGDDTYRGSVGGPASAFV